MCITLKETKISHFNVVADLVRLAMLKKASYKVHNYLLIKENIKYLLT